MCMKKVSFLRIKTIFLAADEMYRDGCTFNLGHIGEQSNDIPKTLRDKYNHIPWKNIIGQRNILFHHYGKIRYDKVLIQNQIEEALKKQSVK